jgi:DNA repair exonuclease SbcCD nuclease subunit
MTYNIAFFADSHIGYRAKTRNNAQGINIRVQDGYDAFREIIAQIIKSEGKDKIDAVICGGDLFHGSHPSIRDIATVQWYLRELAKHGIPFYGLAGNHDATDIRADMAAVAAVNDPDRGIHALYTPYAMYDLADGIVLHSVSHHGLGDDDAPEIKPVADSYNIFTTHGAALDPKNHTLMRCAESPREQFIPVEMIVDDAFIVKLLGHYHSRYAVGGESLNTWYSGSTLRRGFSDAPGDRGWLLVKVDEGVVSVTPQNISQRPQYDLDVIDASGQNASDVMDLLTININRTLEAEKAPIVRQKIINVNRGVREGLDIERINELTKHTLMWSLEKVRPEVEDSIAKKTTKGELSLGKKHSINVLESFDGWVKEQGKSVPEEYRDTVIKDAETYLKQARDQGLLDGHGH